MKMAIKERPETKVRLVKMEPMVKMESKDLLGLLVTREREEILAIKVAMVETERSEQMVPPATRERKVTQEGVDPMVLAAHPVPLDLPVILSSAEIARRTSLPTAGSALPLLQVLQAFIPMIQTLRKLKRTRLQPITRRSKQPKIRKTQSLMTPKSPPKLRSLLPLLNRIHPQKRRTPIRTIKKMTRKTATRVAAVLLCMTSMVSSLPCARTLRKTS